MFFFLILLLIFLETTWGQVHFSFTFAAKEVCFCLSAAVRPWFVLSLIVHSLEFLLKMHCIIVFSIFWFSDSSLGISSLCESVIFFADFFTRTLTQRRQHHCAFNAALQKSLNIIAAGDVRWQQLLILSRMLLDVSRLTLSTDVISCGCSGSFHTCSGARPQLS